MSEPLNDKDVNGGDKRTKWAIRIEDALILLSLGALFVLGVFYRHESWAQIALLPVLFLMLIVFLRRLRRVKKAFEEKRNDL